MKKLFLIIFISFNSFAMEPADVQPHKSFLKRVKEKLTPNVILTRQLCKAAKRGDIPQIKKMLAQGLNPNAKNLYGSYPLNLAAYYGHSEACQVLLDGGANVHVINRHGNDALILAAAQGHLEACKILVAAGASVKTIGQSGSTALLWAMHNNRDVAICKLLIDAGADLWIEDKGGNFFLYACIGISEELYQLGKETLAAFAAHQIKEGATLNTRFSNKKTLLDEVCFWGLDELCTQLIEAGADVNAINKDGIGTLYWGGEARDPKAAARICSILISSGVQFKPATIEYSNSDFLVCSHNTSLINQLVFRPSLDRTQQSKKYIVHLLWCLKQFKPQWPKDLQLLLLSWLPSHLIGDLMIARRCNGKEILPRFERATLQTLHESTLQRLRHEVIMHNEYTGGENWAQRLLHDYTPDEYLDQWSDDILENIKHRLAQPKLLCNGTNE